MIKYFIIIVIYGKRIEESSTLRSFVDFGNILQGRCRILLWDNSPSAYREDEIQNYCDRLLGIEFQYHHNQGENVALSRIYNQSIELLHNDEVLVILDDDSVFDDQLFHKADQAIIEYSDSDLFLPIVRNGKDIVSPAAMVGFKGHYLREVPPGLMSCHHRTAINSGMMIRARYLKHGFEGYDERIRFYFTDNDFMSRYNASHTHFCVLDYQMQHSLNFYARGESYQVKSQRFRDLRRSFLILMRRKGWLSYLSTQLYLFIYSIKFAIIHRDVRYIFVF